MKRALLSLLFLTSLAAAEPVAAPLTLDEAVALAVKQSKGAQLSQLKIDEAAAGTDAARRLRYPQIHGSALGLYLFHPLDLKISQGSLSPALEQAGYGSLLSTTGPFPAGDITLVQGSRTPVAGSLTVTQPLSQLWRIDSGVRAAKAGQAEAQREAARTTAQIRFSVEELFIGSLLEELRHAEYAARLAYQERQLYDAENAHRVGELLDESVLGLRAAVIQARSDVLRSDQQRARLFLQLADLIGRPGTDRLVLASTLPERTPHPVNYWVAGASHNPDRQIAAATVEKAAAGVRAARQAHIPDLSLFATGYAQDGIPLVPNNSGAVGLSLSWDIFDFGRRDAEIARAVARKRSAEVNRDRIEEDSTRQIRLVYQDYTYAGELTMLAQQAVEYRRRAAELARQSTANGLALESKALNAEAELRKAEADLAATRYQQHLALLRLNFLAGEL